MAGQWSGRWSGRWSGDWNEGRNWTQQPAADNERPVADDNHPAAHHVPLPTADLGVADRPRPQLDSDSTGTGDHPQPQQESHNPASSFGALVPLATFGVQEFTRHRGPLMTDQEAARRMDRLRDEALERGLDFIDLTNGERFDWQRFILGQGVEVLHGGGIVRFVASFLPGISDPSRLGCARWDFVAFNSNNTMTRFHPSRHQSAEVLYSATLDDWSVCGRRARPPGARGQPDNYNGILLTLQQAAHPNLSKHDKLGATEVRAILQRLQRQHSGRGFVDVTNGHDLQWWRFIANSAHNARNIIGDGITKVSVELEPLLLWVERVDGSQICVRPGKPMVVYTPED